MVSYSRKALNSDTILIDEYFSLWYNEVTTQLNIIQLIGYDMAYRVFIPMSE